MLKSPTIKHTDGINVQKNRVILVYRVVLKKAKGLTQVLHVKNLATFT